MRLQTLDVGSCLRHVGIGLAYIGAYVWLRHESFSHWILLAGLRLSSLLLLPRRYWLTLLIAELLPTIWMNYLYMRDFGVAWMLFASVPMLALIMPIVWWMGELLPIKGESTSRRMNGLIICALLASIVMAIDSIVSYMIACLPGHSAVDVLWRKIFEYFLGTYVGILGLTPIVLLLFDECNSYGVWMRLWNKLLRAQLPRGSLALLLLLAGLVWLGTEVESGVVRQVIQVGIIMPVVVFALSAGWKGVVVTSFLASIGIVLVMPSRGDDVTLTSQMIMAITATTALLLGARTSVMLWKNQRLAEQNVYLDAMRLNHDVGALDELHMFVNVEYKRLLHRLRGEWHSEDLGSERLSEVRRGFYRSSDKPIVGILRSGRLGSLWRGPIADAFEKAGVIYDIDLPDKSNYVTPQTNILLYLLGCEAIAYLMLNMPTAHIRLCVCAYDKSGWPWFGLEVTSCGQPIHSLRQEVWGGTWGAANEKDLRDRIRPYDCEIQIWRLTDGGGGVSIQLREVPASLLS